MATKVTVAAEINVNSSQAEGAVGSFKKQLKEATADLVNMSMKFGETSVEAQNAAKKVASLKDSIGDAKALADTFNPDKKFVALSGALQGAVAGFTAVQGAMGLFGSESEDLNKTLAKVQSAMALQQGISGVFGAIDSFKLLRAEVMGFTIVQKIVTAGQWLWNAAMAANPIGAIVAVVAALIAGIVALTAWLIKSSDAAKQNATQIKDSAKALEEQKKSADRAADALKRNTDYTLEMLKASGATTEEIRNAERALAAKAVVEASTAFQVAAHTREIESQRLAQMKANGATEENIKAQTENLNKYTENLNEQGKRLTTAKQAELDLIAKHNVQITQEQTDANKKAADKRQEDVDNAKQNAIKRAEANADADKQILSAKQQNTLAMIADENDRAKIAADYDLQNKTDEINRLNITNKRKKELIRLAEEANALTIKGINDKIAEDKKKKDADDLAKTIEKENQRSAILEQIRLNGITDEFTKKQMLLAQQEQQEKDKLTQALNDKLISDEEYRIGKENITKNYDSKEIALAKENADAKEKIAKAEAQAKMDAADAVANTLGSLSKLVGEQTTAGKIFAIAQATISTFTSAQKAYESTVGIPFVGPYLAPVNAGIAVATGIMNIKKIAAVKVPGAGGGGTPPIGGTQNTRPPQITPQMQSTRLDQAQVNQIGNAASRAYVVESDVSNGQERINRLNRAARIN